MAMQLMEIRQCNQFAESMAIGLYLLKGGRIVDSVPKLPLDLGERELAVLWDKGPMDVDQVVVRASGVQHPLPEWADQTPVQQLIFVGRDGENIIWGIPAGSGEYLVNLSPRPRLSKLRVGTAIRVGTAVLIALGLVTWVARK